MGQERGCGDTQQGPGPGRAALCAVRGRGPFTPHAWSWHVCLCEASSQRKGWSKGPARAGQVRAGQGAPGQPCLSEPCEPALHTVSGLAGAGCGGIAAPLWLCGARACPSPTLPAQDQPCGGQRGSEARRAHVTLASCRPGAGGRWREQRGLSQGGAGGGAQGSQPGPQTLDPWSWENRCLRALVGAGEMVVLVVASGKFCTLLFSVRSEKQGPQASAWMRKGVEEA